MANLDQELQKFKTSVMGEEIRNALVSSVTLMNNDLSHIVALGGIPGEKGDPFTYADFTMQQLEALKGDQGPQGEPFKYSDFTPEQLELLKGPKGDEGIQGDEGPQGEKGEPFKYSDFTPEQLALLKGVQGEQGEPFKYSDFTPEQLELLKGEKGDAFTYADFTQAQLNGLVGAKGEPFTYDDFTPEQLELLKGPKGDSGEGTGDMLASTYDTNNNGVVDNAEKVNGFIVEKNVPSDAVFTDTIVDISGKVDKITGKGLSANDFTNTYRDKLVGLENYTHPTTHPYSMITGGPTSLPASDVSEWAKAGAKPSYTKTEIGLANVDNVKQMPISGGILENYTEKLVTLSGTSTTINLSLGNVFTHNLTGNTTYTISNAVSGQAHSFTLIITQTSTVRTLTFPTSVKWQGGEIPDLTTASKTYVLTFVTINGGTTWLGMFGGEF